jgi:hypothetical protein
MVSHSCEEGLGNLGTLHTELATYKVIIKAAILFDRRGLNFETTHVEWSKDFFGRPCWLFICHLGLQYRLSISKGLAIT